MSSEVLYCFEDQDLDEVAHNIADIKVRRLPVMNREKRLVGILALGDMARKGNGSDPAADALKAIPEPAGEHSPSSAHSSPLSSRARRAGPGRHLRVWQ